MRSALSPGRARRAPEVPGRPVPRRPRGDAVAIAVLVALPVLAFGIPALLGHPVLPGDDLTQNFPLRVLAGRQLAAGVLPLYNPYIWGGAPLLAGWNAGAAYPLTALFAVAPATAAWTAGLIVTWAAAGAGLFCFLRALRLAALPSFLGALSFGFAGAMSAQVAHFGLVAGMSWVPVQLLAVLRLSEDRGTASRLRWTAVLGTSFGLTILAGEPRSIGDAAVVVVLYAAWRACRAAGPGRRRGAAAAWVAAGLALGVCLGAVQWLPGLAVLHTSQRAASSAALFDSGSLPHRWLLLMLVPDLLGGSGSFGQPAFFASYNLTEVTGYVGILPLVAAFALLARVRLRPRPPEWLIWHAVALAGLVLALGGNTPAGALLVHLPFFGGQRLQSRNILVADLALAVLLAYWADQPRPEPARGRRAVTETVLAALPALAAIAVVALGLSWGAGLLGWLRVNPGALALAGRLKPWLVPYAVLGVGAVAFVIFGRGLPPRQRARWLAGFVAADVVVFTLLAVVAAGAHLGAGVSAGGGAGAAGRENAEGQANAGAGVNAAAGRPGSRPGAGRAGPGPGAHVAPHGPVPRPVASLGYPGRFAIYDPGQLAAAQLPVLGSPDLNAISGTPSVQGYTSLVDGFYATGTGAHQAMGEGQDVLSPRAAGDGVLDQLDTSALLTVPGYLMTRPGGPGPAPGPPGTGGRDLTAGQRATWYFGTRLDVSAVVVPGAGAGPGAGPGPGAGAGSVPGTGAGPGAAAGFRIGLVTPAGAVRWFPAHAAGPSLAVRLARPVPAVAVLGQAGRVPGRVGPPSVTTADGRRLVADGQLQGAVTAPRWRYAGADGSFAVFADRFARGAFWLQPLPGRQAPAQRGTVTSGAATSGTAGAAAPGASGTGAPAGGIPGATVRRVAGSAGGQAAAEVSSPHGVRVIRSVAAIPGWSATWHPRAGPAVALAVRRDGLVQAVDVPPGRGVVTWSYVPPGFRAGGALSLAAAVLVLLLLLAAAPLAARARAGRS